MKKKFYFDSDEADVFTVTFFHTGSDRCTLLNCDNVVKEDNDYFFYIHGNLVCIVPVEDIEEGSIKYAREY